MGSTSSPGLSARETPDKWPWCRLNCCAPWLVLLFEFYCCFWLVFRSACGIFTFRTLRKDNNSEAIIQLLLCNHISFIQDWITIWTEYINRKRRTNCRTFKQRRPQIFLCGPKATATSTQLGIDKRLSYSACSRSISRVDLPRFISPLPSRFARLAYRSFAALRNPWNQGKQPRTCNWSWCGCAKRDLADISSRPF